MPYAVVERPGRRSRKRKREFIEMVGEKEMDTAVKPREEQPTEKKKTPEEMTYRELKVLLSDWSIYGDYYFRVYRAARKFRYFYTDFEMKRTYDYDEYRESRYNENLLEDRDLWRPNCGISGDYDWKALVAEGKRLRAEETAKSKNERRKRKRQRKKQKLRDAEAAAVGFVMDGVQYGLCNRRMQWIPK